MTTDLLDADIPTETYSVHDDAGFEALPLGTHLEDQDGDRYEKMRGGYREYGDAEPRYTHLYLTAPAVVLNPEVLGSFPIQAGDRAIINAVSGLKSFDGLAVQVLKTDPFSGAWVQPLSERPDGHVLSPFWWPTGDLVTFTPAPLKVGDRVRRISDTHYMRTELIGTGSDYADMECKKGDVGTVSYFAYLNDGIGVDWDKGNTSVIAATQLAPYVDPKPEPVFENFDIEAGTYVQSQEGLDALPSLTIVQPLHTYLPLIKGRDGTWRSIGNVNGERPTPRAAFAASGVRASGGVVLYVPKSSD